MQPETTLPKSQLPNLAGAANLSGPYALKRLARYLRVLTTYQKTYLAHIGDQHPAFYAAMQHKLVSEHLLQRLQSLRVAYGENPNVSRNFEELCHGAITRIARFFGNEEKALLRAIETAEHLIVSVAYGVLRNPSSSAELTSISSDVIDSLSIGPFQK